MIANKLILAVEILTPYGQEVKMEEELGFEWDEEVEAWTY